MELMGFSFSVVTPAYNPRLNEAANFSIFVTQ